jgi:hypothetical protein
MNNYFQVIDGIKYDTEQATAICQGEFTEEEKPSLQFKYRKFRKPLLEYTRIAINISKYIIYKGINGGYFMYRTWKNDYKIIDHLNNDKKTINESSFFHQEIKPLTRDEAINYYFGEYYFSDHKFYDWYCSSNCVIMTPLVTEEEAFEGIPVA